MNLDDAQKKVTSATQVANEYSAGANTIQDVLKEKINKIYDYNTDIVKPLDTATTNYLSAPATAREKYQGVFNPFTKEKLVSQYTSNQMLPMLTWGNLYGSRQGSIADTINAGTNAYNAQAQTAMNNATLAQAEYDNLLKAMDAQTKTSSSSFDPSNIQAFIDALKQNKNGGMSDTGGLENDLDIFDDIPGVTNTQNTQQVTTANPVSSILDTPQSNNRGWWDKLWSAILNQDQPYQAPVQPLQVKLPF